MEEEVYNKIVLLDGSDNVINATTDAFVKDTTGWTTIGTQSDRHWKIEILDEDFNPIYKLVDGELVAN